MLDQKVDDDGCEQAWLSHPRVGATLFFPGDRLHCVLPSAPPPEAPSAATAAAATIATATATAGKGKKGKKRARVAVDAPAAALGALTPSAAQPQRVTLMIGFWGKPVHKACKREAYDACGPVPKASEACTWPATLSLPNDKKQSRRDIDQACAAAREQPPPCYAVPCIDGSPWQRIKGSGEGARFASPPEARNHRFFVERLSEFREVVCTPPPVDG